MVVELPIGIALKALLPHLDLVLLYRFNGSLSFCVVASGKWQVASGKWQVASGKWQVASGKWQAASG